MPKKQTTKNNPTLEKLLKRRSSQDVIQDLEIYYQSGAVKEVPLNSVFDNEFLSSVKLSQKALQKAAITLSQNVVSVSVIVRRNKGKFEIVTNRLYYLAAVELRMSNIPVIEIKMDDFSMVMTLIHSLKNYKDRNIIEVGSLLEALVKKYELTLSEISMITDISLSQISNILRVMKLPSQVVDLVSTNVISFGHAKVLCSVTKEQLKGFCARIVDQNLSVRAVEQERRQSINPNVVITAETSDTITIKFDNSEAKQKYIKKNKITKL